MYVLSYSIYHSLFDISLNIIFSRSVHIAASGRISFFLCLSNILFYTHTHTHTHTGFPGGSVVKNLPANSADAGSIPGLGRYPEEGNGNPLQYSCLGNPMDKGAWQSTVHGVAKSKTQVSAHITTTTYLYTTS